MSLHVSVLLAGVAAAAPSSTSTSTPAAACAVVQRYYAALDRHDYHIAYGSWDRGGQASRQSYAQFIRGFANTRHTRVVVGEPTRPEGAAGSTYIRVPVTVHATLMSGTAQVFAGSYTLRHVNDIDGATPEQQKWHLDSASLRRR